MKNRKQLLADFYLDLLAIHSDDFKFAHSRLYTETLNSLAYELQEEIDIVKNIFERMASEDVVPKPAVNPNYCPRCDREFTNIGDYARHKCFMKEFK